MRLACLLLTGAAALAQDKASIEKQLQSIEQQRESIRKMMPIPQHPVAAALPDCDPLPDEQVKPIVESAARARQLPEKLLRAVIEQESGFRPCAVSEKGAQGLMQL